MNSWATPPSHHNQGQAQFQNQSLNAGVYDNSRTSASGIGISGSSSDASSVNLNGSASSSENWIQNSVGDTITSNEGVSNSTNVNVSDDSSDFIYAPGSWNTTASCMKGFQAGGSESGNWGGALGFHWKDKDCWYMMLAGQEPHIETKARLLCMSDAYMEAVTYGAHPDHGPRRAQCISIVRANLKAFVRYIAAGQDGRRVKFLPEQGRQ